MVYKSLNTFIDDLFAFIIKMPTMHRLSCFRDDIIFFIYLYQRWIYPVDKTRINEFGQLTEENIGSVEGATEEEKVSFLKGKKGEGEEEEERVRKDGKEGDGEEEEEEGDREDEKPLSSSVVKGEEGDGEGQEEEVSSATGGGGGGGGGGGEDVTPIDGKDEGAAI